MPDLRHQDAPGRQLLRLRRLWRDQRLQLETGKVAADADHRNQPLNDFTQADLDQWLIDGATTRRAVRYFLQWARARHLTSEVSVPLPPRSEPVRLLGEDDHIRQLDRCLSDDSMASDLRVGGALVLLFGLLVSRVMQLTKDDVHDDGEVTYLDIDTTT